VRVREMKFGRIGRCLSEFSYISTPDKHLEENKETKDRPSYDSFE
jgi:hypothetical protein